MKLKNTLATLPLVLNACGSDESSSGFSPEDPAQGLWTGGFSSTPITTTSASGAISSTEISSIEKAGVALYTSDKRVFFYDISSDILFANDIPGYFGQIIYYSPNYFVNSVSNDKVAMDGNVYTATSILGAISSPLSGNYAMVFDDKYFRGADLNRLSGGWFYAGPAGNWNISVLSDGSFTATLSSISSCVVSGIFSTIDTRYNEYAIDNISFESCGGYDGNYSGLAATIDTSQQNDTLLMAVFNTDHGFFMQPVKN